jgi:pimeloyl-ACP methyl ester carboxylesterase
MTSIQAPIERRSVTSADGTALTCYLVGRGPRRWLMPPAMGAPLVSMKPLFDRLGDRYTFAYWDMRGFHRSGAPADPQAYAVTDHVADLLAVRDDLGWDRFVLGGWSMGVQISLELHRHHAEQIQALVLINGPYERILDAVVPLRFVTPVVCGLLGRVRHIAPLINPLTRRGLGHPGIGPFMRRIGILARQDELFDEVLGEFRSVDWGRYLTVMRKLHEHSAADELSRITVPTLITAGGRDRMTPVATAEAMHQAIAGSELFVIPHGTHYMPIEYPDELGDRIERFLERVETQAAGVFR